MESPTKIYQKNLETPIGMMVACATDSGICLLEFLEKKALPRELKELSKHFNSEIEEQNHPHFDLLERELKDYFEGNLKEFTVPMVFVGTDFQKKIWEILCKIPYGTTRSYREQSELFGNLKAIRAVASANGANKISILVPCHRVIGSNGTLTGYSGGIERKKELLRLENISLF